MTYNIYLCLEHSRLRGLAIFKLRFRRNLKRLCLLSCLLFHKHGTELLGKINKQNIKTHTLASSLKKIITYLAQKSEKNQCVSNTKIGKNYRISHEKITCITQ